MAAKRLVNHKTQEARERAEASNSALRSRRSRWSRTACWRDPDRWSLLTGNSTILPRVCMRPSPSASIPYGAAAARVSTAPRLSFLTISVAT